LVGEQVPIFLANFNLLSKWNGTCVAVECLDILDGCKKLKAKVNNQLNPTVRVFLEITPLLGAPEVIEFVGDDTVTVDLNCGDRVCMKYEVEDTIIITEPVTVCLKIKDRYDFC
jgi:hypothetical protein